MIRAESIADSASLDQVVEAARASGCVGLDTEFMREKTYRAQLCLVQIASPGNISVVDPLLPLDLTPVAKLLADPDVEVILHAGRQDLELFYDEFKVIPSNVFDIQVAAGFAGLGASLSYGSLVKSVLGVTLEKGESYTDWCRRPLTGRQMEYAADDVRWLVDAANKIKDRLRQLGRLDWALEEMRPLSDRASYELDLDQLWRRVSGRGNLSGKQLSVLREVARWREEEAMKRNLPRGWLVKDATLVEIARRQPSTPDKLGRIRGFNSREVQKSGNGIIEAVRKGQSRSAPETARAPKREDQVRARLIGGLADVVVRTRAEAAGIAPELVATRGDVESLLLHLFAGKDVDSAQDGHRLLQGWRRGLAGDAVVALAEGRLGVKGIDRSPFIEEVEV